MGEKRAKIRLHVNLDLFPSLLPLPHTLTHTHTLSQDGMVYERGMHSELLERGGVYASMWNQQQQSLDKGGVAKQGSEGKGETEL